jgi:hypothetical protein
MAHIVCLRVSSTSTSTFELNVVVVMLPIRRTASPYTPTLLDRRVVASHCEMPRGVQCPVWPRKSV